MRNTTDLSRVTVSPAVLRPFKALIEGAGLAPGDLLAAARLPVDLFEREDGYRVRLADYFRLCEQTALAIGDETIHVSLRPLMLGTSDFIRERLRGAASVGGMLETLAESYNVIHGARYNSVRQLRDELVFAMDDRDFPYALDKDDAFLLFSLEALLVYVHLLLQSSSPGDPLPLRSIRTRRPRSDASPLAAWGVPVVQGSRTFSLHYESSAAGRAVDPANCPVLGARTIYGGIARALERGAATGLADRLADRVRAALAEGLTRQQEVARELGMSPATLRRRLGERGTSFRDLRAEALAGIARLRLKSGASTAAVAEELGFSDGRSFARAFRGWTGRSPREFRLERAAD